MKFASLSTLLFCLLLICQSSFAQGSPGIVQLYQEDGTQFQPVNYAPGLSPYASLRCSVELLDDLSNDCVSIATSIANLGEHRFERILRVCICDSLAPLRDEYFQCERGTQGAELFRQIWNVAECGAIS